MKNWLADCPISYFCSYAISIANKKVRKEGKRKIGKIGKIKVKGKKRRDESKNSMMAKKGKLKLDTLS